MTDPFLPAKTPHDGGALRMALIVVPIIGVIVAIGLKLAFDPIFEGRRLRGIISGVFITFIYPLTSLALCLWAANMLKPIGWLNQKLLKRALITFAIAGPLNALYNYYAPIKMIFGRPPEEVWRYLGTYITSFMGSICYSLVLLFAARTIDVTQNDDEVTF